MLDDPLQLNPEKIQATAERLMRRIRERFPSSGLWNLSLDLLRLSREAEVNTQAIGRPMLLVRLVIALCMLTLAAICVKVATMLHSSPEILSITEFFQTLSSSIEVLAFFSALVLFLTSLEARIKRGRALRLLSQLRTLAHLIDLHQQTKSPDTTTTRAAPTKSSPLRQLTPIELSRYYDYSSELLALVSIMAALYVQSFADPQALAAAEQIEDLTTGLSQKIWQKSTLLSTRLVAENLGVSAPKDSHF